MEKINANDINISKLDADAILINGLNTVYFISGVLAVIVIIVAGYIYVTSAGNATNVEKAKSAIMYAVVGLVIVLLAFVLTNYVIGIFNN